MNGLLKLLLALKWRKALQKRSLLPWRAGQATKVSHTVGHGQVAGPYGHVVHSYLIEGLLREFYVGRFAFHQHPGLTRAIMNNYVGPLLHVVVFQPGLHAEKRFR